MQTKWVVFFVMLYIFGTLFGTMMEASQFSDQDTVMQEINDALQINTWSVLGVTIPKPSTAWVNVFSKGLLWDFKFFKNPDGTPNDWALVKWVLFFPISIGMVVSLTVTFLPLILMGARAVAGVIRSLVPI